MCCTIHSGTHATAAQVLWSLSINHGHRIMIAENGGLEVLIAAMTHHPRAADLQHRACGLLQNFSADEADSAYIVQLGLHAVLRVSLTLCLAGRH